MTTAQHNTRSAGLLWKDYAFLTQEMNKMLLKQDIDLFLELMEQREKIQASITALAEDTYKTSPEGRQLLVAIDSQNKTITKALQSLYNNQKHRHQVANAYDGLGNRYTGIRMDRES